MIKLSISCLLIGCLFAVSSWAKTPGQQVIAGWVERVYVQSINSSFKAKLDTGAMTSSMRADVLSVDDSNPDQQRVVFQIENDKGETNTLERKLVRFVRIKSKDGGWQRRPVVMMDFCMAGRHVSSEVNLAAREDFIYPVLVGRNMMQAGGMIVDPSRTFIAPAQCSETKTHAEDETNAAVTPSSAK